MSEQELRRLVQKDGVSQKLVEVLSRMKPGIQPVEVTGRDGETVRFRVARLSRVGSQLYLDQGSSAGESMTKTAEESLRELTESHLQEIEQMAETGWFQDWDFAVKVQLAQIGVDFFRSNGETESLSRWSLFNAYGGDVRLWADDLLSAYRKRRFLGYVSTFLRWIAALTYLVIVLSRLGEPFLRFDNWLAAFAAAGLLLDAVCFFLRWKLDGKKRLGKDWPDRIVSIAFALSALRYVIHVL